MAIDKAVDSTQLNADLTSIANAIRTKGETSAPLAFPNGFISAIQDMQTGGVTVVETQDTKGGKIIEISGDATKVEPITITENGITTAPTGTAYSPITVNVPSSTDEIYKKMIEADPSVIRLSSDDITDIEGWRIAHDNTEINLPNVTQILHTIGTYVKTLVMENLQTVVTRMFYNNTSLVNVWCPIMAGAPNARNTGMQRHFSGCTKIEHLYLSKWKYIGYDSFYNNTSLKSLTFDDLITLSNIGSAPLDALIIRNSSTTLSGTTVISNTGIGTGNGYIYVPSASISYYKTATNWSTFESKFIGIDEDTTVNVGTQFTPATTASGIVSFDKYDLQSYSTGSINTSTGAITPTYDGRCLIRGYDSNGNIVHVTYLQIGTGYSWEAVTA